MPVLTVNSVSEHLIRNNSSISEDFTIKKAASLPLKMVQESTRWTRAILNRDYEKEINSAGKIAAQADFVLTFLSAPLQIVATLGHYFQDCFAYSSWSFVIRIITLPLSIFYLWLALVEGIYEYSNLSRSWNLLKNMHRTEWHNREVALQDLSFLRSQFFELTPQEQKKCQASQAVSEKALAAKSAALSRRVSHWCAKEITSQINGLIEGLKDGDVKAHQRAIELLNSVDVQSKKKLLIHAIGLSALAIFALSVILILASNPVTLLTTTLSILGILLSAVRFGLEKGVLTQKGWHFSTRDSLNWLRC